MATTCPGRQALRALASYLEGRPCSAPGHLIWKPPHQLHDAPLGASARRRAPAQQQPQRRSLVALASLRDDLLRGVNADNREAVARILEQAERAVDSWTVVHSDFCTPPVAADAQAALGRMSDVVAVTWGGYPQAERCRVSVGREEAMAGAPEDPGAVLGSVAAVVCRGNFLFDPATHRDFLGAALGTGIDRSKLGDIVLVGESGAQICVAPSLVEHLEASLTQVRSVPVTTRAVALGELQVRPAAVEEVTTTEASMRLDAVASAGFRTSRSKILDLIKGGDVRVNWRSAGVKPSSTLAPGDMISCAGKGRVEVLAASLNKKGRYVVQLRRYV